MHYFLLEQARDRHSEGKPDKPSSSSESAHLSPSLQRPRVTPIPAAGGAVASPRSPPYWHTPMERHQNAVEMSFFYHLHRSKAPRQDKELLFLPSSLAQGPSCPRWGHQGAPPGPSPDTPAEPDGRNALKDSLNPRLESAAAVPEPQPAAPRSLLSAGQREAAGTRQGSWPSRLCWGEPATDPLGSLKPSQQRISPRYPI